jgi:phosphopantothenoylcysteine decarboxylase/phosphopantothenate--cysteine ligase
MGYVLAEAALARGAKVTLVSGPSHLKAPAGVDLVEVETAAEMREAVLDRAGEADVIVKAAAVADFTPDRTAPKKLKKDQGAPDIHLVPTRDILAELGRSPELRKEGGLLVGFAAETEGDPRLLGDLAESKRRSKGADLVVANEVGVADSGFNASTNRAVIASPAGVEELGLVTKTALAAALLDRLTVLLGDQTRT